MESPAAAACRASSPPCAFLLRLHRGFFLLILFWMEPRPRGSPGMVCGDPKSCWWFSCRGCGGSHRAVLGVGDAVMCDGMGPRVMGWVQELSTHGCLYKRHHPEPSGAARSAPCGSDLVDQASKVASKAGLVREGGWFVPLGRCYRVSASEERRLVGSLSVPEMWQHGARPPETPVR